MSTIEEHDLLLMDKETLRATVRDLSRAYLEIAQEHQAAEQVLRIEVSLRKDKEESLREANAEKDAMYEELETLRADSEKVQKYLAEKLDMDSQTALHIQKEESLVFTVEAMLTLAKNLGRTTK